MPDISLVFDPPGDKLGNQDVKVTVTSLGGYEGTVTLTVAPGITTTEVDPVPTVKTPNIFVPAGQSRSTLVRIGNVKKQPVSLVIQGDPGLGLPLRSTPPTNLVKGTFNLQLNPVVLQCENNVLLKLEATSQNRFRGTVTLTVPPPHTLRDSTLGLTVGGAASTFLEVGSVNVMTDVIVSGVASTDVTNNCSVQVQPGAVQFVAPDPVNQNTKNKINLSSADATCKKWEGTVTLESSQPAQVIFIPTSVFVPAGAESADVNMSVGAGIAAGPLVLTARNGANVIGTRTINVVRTIVAVPECDELAAGQAAKSERKAQGKKASSGNGKPGTGSASSRKKSTSRKS